MFLLTAITTFVGTALVIAAPMSAAVVLPMCAIIPTAWNWMAEGRLISLTLLPAVRVLFLAAVYVQINAFWSLTFASASASAISLVVLAAALQVTIGNLFANGFRPLKAMAIGFYGAMVLAGICLCFELWTNQWILLRIMNAVSWLRPDIRYMTIAGDRIVALAPNFLNRSIAAWTMLFWPALAMLVVLGRREKRLTLFLGCGLLPGVSAIVLSEHDTSKLAFIGATAALVVALVSRRFARLITATAWLVATVLVVPICSFALSSQLYLLPWLPPNAQERIVIWGHTSLQVWKAPILGVGVNSSTVISRGADPKAARAPGSNRLLSIRHHPHNAYLQVWYEAGAIGAFLLAVIGLLTVCSTTTTRITLQPIYIASFVACALMAASGFSIWHAWFMSLLGLVAIFAILGCSADKCIQFKRARE